MSATVALDVELKSPIESVWQALTEAGADGLRRRR